MFDQWVGKSNPSLFPLPPSLSLPLPPLPSLSPQPVPSPIFAAELVVIVMKGNLFDLLFNLGFPRKKNKDVPRDISRKER